MFTNFTLVDISNWHIILQNSKQLKLSPYEVKLLLYLKRLVNLNHLQSLHHQFKFQLVLETWKQVYTQNYDVSQGLVYLIPSNIINIATNVSSFKSTHDTILYVSSLATSICLQNRTFHTFMRLRCFCRTFLIINLLTQCFQA